MVDHGESAEIVAGNGSLFGAFAEVNEQTANDPQLQVASTLFQALAGLYIATHPSVKSKADLLDGTKIKDLQNVLLSNVLKGIGEDALHFDDKGNLFINQSKLGEFITQYFAEKQVAVAA